MGMMYDRTPVAVIYAFICYAYHKKYGLTPRFDHLQAFYRRMVDNGFGIWPIWLGTKVEYSSFVDALNGFGVLRWIAEPLSDSVSFLDVVDPVTCCIPAYGRCMTMYRKRVPLV